MRGKHRIRELRGIVRGKHESKDAVGGGHGPRGSRGTEVTLIVEAWWTLERMGEQLPQTIAPTRPAVMPVVPPMARPPAPPAVLQLKATKGKHIRAQSRIWSLRATTGKRGKRQTLGRDIETHASDQRLRTRRDLWTLRGHFEHSNLLSPFHLYFPKISLILINLFEPPSRPKCLVEKIRPSSFWYANISNFSSY